MGLANSFCLLFQTEVYNYIRQINAVTLGKISQRTRSWLRVAQDILLYWLPVLHLGPALGEILPCNAFSTTPSK